VADRSLLVKKKEVFFDISISQGMYWEMEPKDEDFITYVPEFILTSFPGSLKAIFAVNFASSFEIYLIDPHRTLSQISLRRMLDIELLTSTRNAQVYAISRNLEAGLFVVSTTNRNFMCFNQSGHYIRAVSEVIFYQNIASNKNTFLEKLMAGGKDASEAALEADEVCQVDLVSVDESSTKGQFLMFYGKRILSVSLHLQNVREEQERGGPHAS